MSDGLPILRPGDLLLYAPTDWIDWCVAIKTWHRFSHCEVYDGPGKSLASRNGIGVNRYAFRQNKLARILRPPATYNHTRAVRWFELVKGQKYDWLGLLCFTLAVKQGSPDKQFCSEFATNLYRAGQFEPFQPEDSSDTIAPATFVYSFPMQTVWMSGSNT